MNYIYNWFKPATISPQYSRLSLVLDDLIKNNLLSSDSSIADLYNILDREIAADVSQFRVYTGIINADDICDMHEVITDLIKKNNLTKGSIVNNFYYILTNGKYALQSTVPVIINGTTMWSKQPKYTSADLFTMRSKLEELDTNDHIDEEKIKKLRQVIRNNQFTYEEQIAFINKITDASVCSATVPEPVPFETKEDHCEQLASAIKLGECLLREADLCDVDKIKLPKASFIGANIIRDNGATYQLHAEDYDAVLNNITGAKYVKAIDNFLTDDPQTGDDPLQIHLKI